MTEKKWYALRVYSGKEARVKAHIENEIELQKIEDEKKKEWIKKDGKAWILTTEGERNGGQMKKGQYGEYAAWPEEIIKEIDGNSVQKNKLEQNFNEIKKKLTGEYFRKSLIKVFYLLQVIFYSHFMLKNQNWFFLVV